MIIDEKNAEGKYHFQHVMRLNSLLRSGTDVLVAPSGSVASEPCGLIQGEGFCRGKKVLATDVGGLHDTVRSHGEHPNGWLVPRHSNWDGSEQAAAFAHGVHEAIEETKGMLGALYSDNPETAFAPYQQKIARIMSEGQSSTWDESFDGSLPPIMQYEWMALAALWLRTHRYDIPTRLDLLQHRA